MNSTKPSPDALSKLACAALRGEAPAWPFGSDLEATKTFLGHAGYHGIGPLLWEAMSAKTIWQYWPGGIREALGKEYRALTALEMLRKQELQRVFAALEQAGIEALLLKGAALAYGLYAKPWLRTRSDSDIFVAPEFKDQAGDVFIALGYRKPVAIEGEYIKTQAQYLYEAREPRQTIDLHWRLSNTHVFANTFSFAQLRRDAEPLPALGAAASMPSRVNALLHACAHRAINLPHREGNRLIWLYDIHLLTSELSEDEWAEFTQGAAEKQMRAVCADALTAAHARFNTPLPEKVLGQLRAEGAGKEMSAALLRAGPLRARLLSYRALSSWSARSRMLREHAVPSRAFMQKRFGAQGGWSLARAYVHRIITGLRGSPEGS